MRLSKDQLVQFAQANGIACQDNFIVVHPTHTEPKGLRKVFNALTDARKRDHLIDKTNIAFISPKEFILLEVDNKGNLLGVEEGFSRTDLEGFEYAPDKGFGHLLFKINGKPRIYKVPGLILGCDWHRANLRELKENNFFID